MAGNEVKTSQDLFTRGSKAFSNNQFSKAVDLFSQALALEPENVEILLSRSHANTKNEAYKEAKKDANTAIDIARSPEHSKRFKLSLSKAFLRSGVSSFHMGNYAEAKNCFLEAKKQSNPEMGLDQWVAWCEEKMAKLKAQPDAQPSPAPEVPTAIVAAPKLVAIKHDFYQSELQVVIEIRIKGLKPVDVNVKFDADTLKVAVNNINTNVYDSKDYNLDLDLAHPVIPEKCSFKVMSTKVEIRLTKKDGIRWPKLEKVAGSEPLPAVAVAAQPPAYPSSKSGKNWDRIAVDIEQELAKDKPEGEQALNELFQKIYCDADEDTKRAMNKSFQESGGTVLSTNWADIGKKKTEVKPPEGMEFKKWN